MRALDPEVVDAIWAAVEPLLPPPDKSHPLGCHNPRISDRICFDGILIRLVTGVSWVTVERLMRNVVSDTTLRARRDEWITAGVFDALADEALHAYDRIIQNTDARVVVHWRYASIDVGYLFPEARYWTDEYFYIYPDCSAVRKVRFRDGNAHLRIIGKKRRIRRFGDTRITITTANLSRRHKFNGVAEGITQRQPHQNCLCLFNTHA